MFPSIFIPHNSSQKRDVYSRDTPYTQVISDKTVLLRKFIQDKSLPRFKSFQKPVRYQIIVQDAVKNALIVDSLQSQTHLSSEFLMVFHLKEIVRRLQARLPRYDSCSTVSGKVSYFGEIVEDVNLLRLTDISALFKKTVAKVYNHEELIETCLSWNYFEMDARTPNGVREAAQYINEDVLFREDEFPVYFSDSYIESLFIKIIKLCFRGILLTNVKNHTWEFERVLVLIEQALSHVTIIGEFNKIDYLRF